MADKLCACGCGGVIVVKYHHKYTGVPDYIHGHNIKGVNNPMKFPETARKSGRSKIGKQRSDETRKKISVTKMGHEKSDETLTKW